MLCSKGRVGSTPTTGTTWALERPDHFVSRGKRDHHQREVDDYRGRDETDGHLKQSPVADVGNSDRDNGDHGERESNERNEEPNDDGDHREHPRSESRSTAR